MLNDIIYYNTMSDDVIDDDVMVDDIMCDENSIMLYKFFIKKAF